MGDHRISDDLKRATLDLRARGLDSDQEICRIVDFSLSTLLVHISNLCIETFAIGFGFTFLRHSCPGLKRLEKWCKIYMYSQALVIVVVAVAVFKVQCRERDCMHMKQ
jgi:hypothetical protein